LRVGLVLDTGWRRRERAIAGPSLLQCSSGGEQRRLLLLAFLSVIGDARARLSLSLCLSFAMEHTATSLDSIKQSWVQRRWPWRGEAVLLLGWPARRERDQTAAAQREEQFAGARSWRTSRDSSTSFVAKRCPKRAIRKEGERRREREGRF